MTDDILILVVDDNQENLKVVSNFLKELDYKIALASDGESALHILETEKFDLILLDIMMPGMDGFEVCNKLKENADTKDIPVIFLTARNETDDIIRGFQMGGVDYITKPFRKEELLIRVKNHVKLKQIRDYLTKNEMETRQSRDFFMKAFYDLQRIVNRTR